MDMRFFVLKDSCRLKMEVIEDLLIGNYHILQDTEQYRFTSDSVLLARFLTAKKGERVADFCAGCGIVGMHFFAENENTQEVVFFEMQEKLSLLCKKSIMLNGLQEKLFCENVRLQDIPANYTEHFSLILCNPPYGKGGIVSPKEGRALACSELTLSMEELCTAASKCLKFGGRFALVHRADRLPELVTCLKNHNLEPKKMQLVSGTERAKPYAVLLAAVKGGKPGLDVLPTAVNQKETP